MKLVLILNLIFFVEVFGDGEVVFLSKPPNIEFRGHEEVDLSIIKDICSTSLGFTTYSTSDWPGMYIKSPFNFAQAIVGITVHGVASLPTNKGHTFSYVAYSSADDMMSTLESKILERYPNAENQSSVELNFDDEIRYNEINLNKGKLQVEKPTVKFLKEEEDEVQTFLNQMGTWMAVLKKIEKKGVTHNGLPDLYWLNLRGLHPIIDIYGESSPSGIEAKELVMSAMEKTKNVFEKAYKKRVLVFAMMSDAAHTRRFRRASGEITADLKLAPVYDENYPVFFNIFLWFTIAFIMTIIATSMVTACMDPGRDSIIYRMTSTRMKKDN